MQEKQKQPPYRITVIENDLHGKIQRDEHSPIKASAVYPRRQDSHSPNQKKVNPSAERCCECPESFKRQLLRMFFIPLLIVLFLLTIALTFKQNNYQTNDYFYSKNIEINRKIRGVVPPLNETKEDIFGEYTIGLVQKFSVKNRRMFEGWKVELWKNESMRVTEFGKGNQCWAMYKLKFYSSTIFVSRIQNHIYVDGNSSSSARKLQNLVNEGEAQTIQIDDLSNSNDESDDKNPTSDPLPIDSKDQGKFSTESSEENSSLQSLVKTDQESITDTENSICSIDLWSTLNEILYESHIWTFGEDNFYLLEFSQLGEEGNGVLIMKMVQKYLNSV